MPGRLVPDQRLAYPLLNGRVDFSLVVVVVVTARPATWLELIYHIPARFVTGVPATLQEKQQINVKYHKELTAIPSISSDMNTVPLPGMVQPHQLLMMSVKKVDDGCLTKDGVKNPGCFSIVVLVLQMIEAILESPWS